MLSCIDSSTDAFDSRFHDKRSFVGQPIDDVLEAFNEQGLVFVGEIYLEFLKQDFAFLREVNQIFKRN